MERSSEIKPITFRAAICVAALFCGVLIGASVVISSTSSAQAQSLYTVDRDGFLREVDPSNGATLSIFPITLTGRTVLGATGLATDPTDQILYALLKLVDKDDPEEVQGGRELVTVDPATGTATRIGNTDETLECVISFECVRFSDLAFDKIGTLYGVSGDGSTPPETLFTLDKTNAAPTLFLALGNGTFGEAIAFNRDDGLMYHLSGAGSKD